MEESIIEGKLVQDLDGTFNFSSEYYSEILNHPIPN